MLRFELLFVLLLFVVVVLLLLFVACYLLFVVCCLLFVVGCWLSVCLLLKLCMLCVALFNFFWLCFDVSYVLRRYVHFTRFLRCLCCRCLRFAMGLICQPSPPQKKRWFFEKFARKLKNVQSRCHEVVKCSWACFRVVFDREFGFCIENCI